jgi:hypothetical protein
LRAGLRPKYVESLRQYLAQFARGRENRDIAEIKLADLEKWFAGREEAFSTQASNMGRLSALFAFHVRRPAVALVGVSLGAYLAGLTGCGDAHLASAERGSH